jgi:hypothetical protein
MTWFTVMSARCGGDASPRLHRARLAERRNGRYALPATGDALTS